MNWARQITLLVDEHAAAACAIRERIRQSRTDIAAREVAYAEAALADRCAREQPERAAHRPDRQAPTSTAPGDDDFPLPDSWLS